MSLVFYAVNFGAYKALLTAAFSFRMINELIYMLLNTVITKKLSLKCKGAFGESCVIMRLVSKPKL